ncbi:MAG: hypothetical protein A2023_00085 [Sulfuricurvum sp. GWF2_44_89]|uniref:Uncharacterized protein n=2 Tax=Sulfuricurvum TaxID=286130 RepID=A0A2D3W8Q8_9BACT|nr:MAG: hypothetical protein A2023_00085 [Sulfuricurvum sp. GWF2_44_89]OHD95156.1 MAG: hypothetical protein A2517_11260 [Sulfuricurvum sp. RIFOXYD12_FULL_44_77]OHD99720.1 MAG: hypothetical protein A2552_09860 [Sulfuricurvum sp. RIFOXYD2_FULL_44_160]DAB37722.1 MAG TPA: hypothetical protein CFH83_09675 [Sulfuricurvum kujiense]
MKFLSLSLLFILMSTNLFSAEKKWIPIEPIDMNEKRKIDTNSSKPQASNKTIQNLKIIKNLLDHVNKGEINTENEKTWYSLDPIDDN